MQGHFDIYHERSFEELIADLKAELLKVLPGMERQIEEFIFAVLSDKDGIILLKDLDSESAMNIAKALSTAIECCNGLMPAGNIGTITPDDLSNSLSGNFKVLNFALLTGIDDLQQILSLMKIVRENDSSKHLLMIATYDSGSQLPEALQRRCLANIKFEKLNSSVDGAKSLSGILPAIGIDQLESMRLKYRGMKLSVPEK